MKVNSMYGRDEVEVKEATAVHHQPTERIQQLEFAIDALFENIKNWPTTMTRERLLNDLYAAKQGYYLETLT